MIATEDAELYDLRWRVWARLDAVNPITKETAMATHPVIRVKATGKIGVEKDNNLGKGKVYKGTTGELVEWNPANPTGTPATDGVVIQFDAAIFDNGTKKPKPVFCTEDQFEVMGVIDRDDAQG